MKQKLLPFILIFPLLSVASYFSDGMRAYKQGNYKEAKAQFEQAIEEEGSEQANFFLGLLYLKGMGVERDISAAKRFLAKAAEAGNARAKCYLAEAYLLQNQSDKQVALKLLKEGKNAGASECLEIATTYKIPL
ncbi:tetratricopeptide repeat protein [Hydrogenimonas urashimensis]|uniref:tetratricopeptide repeat protein n=1 Tax=Hydrogenimonas urashimensis TaxID=2740515 RepID=UPI0019169029|nr:sel1 repeat family protein [Hydrogenimonas urashimensis]